MGSRAIRGVVVLALTLGVAGPVAAQVPRIQITGVRLGYAGGVAKLQRLKAGAWAPVSIDVQCGLEPLSKLDYEIVVETTDGDDTPNTYVERRVPSLEPKENAILMSYVRPGTSSSEVTVRLRSRRNGETLAQNKSGRSGTSVDILPPSVFYYLTVGGPLGGMKRSLAPAKAGAIPGGQPMPGPGGMGKRPPPPQKPGMPPGGDAGGVAGGDDAAPEEIEPEETGHRRFAHIDAADQMPLVWFGYDTADVVILTSGSERFVADLNRGNDDLAAARLAALAEWVRRGGRLVVSVGHNHQVMAQVLGKLQLLDLDVKGQQTGIKRLNGVERWASAQNQPLRGRPPADRAGEYPDLEVARLLPGRGVQVVVTDRPDPRDKEARPVVVQGACGLGRVIVLGMDVDQPPFSSWAGQKGFWEGLARMLEPPALAQGNLPQFQANMWQQSQELAGKLQDGLESFPDVPVISFGWVALFILIYILIVGPLDYFVLKKVVKRLELTWITFPTVVILISTLAYFAAYKLKGNDLRINKVDVVDIDLHRGHAYGNSWFTLFSPRIQNYTVGVEPASPGWGKPLAAPAEAAPLVGWMAHPEGSAGMRGGGQGLFRRAYEYAPEASGLIGVPIQVWSTKSFSGSWRRTVGDKELIEADLAFSKAQEGKVGGTITSHLPVELQGVVLIYGGRTYNLDRLVPESPVRIDARNVGVGPSGDLDTATWLSGPFPGLSRQVQQQQTRMGWQNPGVSLPLTSYMKSMMFYGYGSTASGNLHNSGLRHLDQRWRLDRDNRDEAILVGRAAPPVGQSGEGPAETVAQGGLTATQLWLGELPGQGKRPALAGTLAQDTYVRVYIPVR